MSNFKSEAYAKCIIAGEHSVLRGHPALVIPVKTTALKSEWDLTEQALELEFNGPFGRELSLIFAGALDQACKYLGIRRSDLKGHWKLHNEIQIGGGLGASAAICVTISRYFVSTGQLKEDEVYNFAKNLEDLFHGESSGVDIAASMSHSPLSFVRNGPRKKIESLWDPIFCISFSGHKGMTSDCVEKVKTFIAQNPQRGEQLDQKMHEAVEKSLQALEMNSTRGFQILSEAITLASSCFEEWGLIDGPMAKEMQRLKSLGAVAVKPTGSGLGGYLLSLWKDPAQIQNKENLIYLK